MKEFDLVELGRKCISYMHLKSTCTDCPDGLITLFYLATKKTQQ